MSTVSKSYETDNKIIKYCAKISANLHHVEKELQEATAAKAKNAGMIGAPEVLELGRGLIHLINAKKVLDVGTFTGASALAWAIGLPDDGKVISVDVSHEALNSIGLPIIEKHPELRKKIDFRLGSALDTLKSLHAAGGEGTYDFAFIDADKGNYSNYYLNIMELLKPGGVIMVDNALWGGQVVDPKEDSDKAIDAMNRLVAADDRVYNNLINVGDGVHLIFKKHYS